jgi:hypothetical protein
MLRVQTIHTGVGGVGYTSHYFGSNDIADADEAQERVREFWDTTKQTRQNGTTATVQGEVQLIDAVTGQLEDIEGLDSIAVQGGAAAQERVGDALQVLCRLRTAGFRFGRRVRGRFFVPGTASQFQAGGNFGSTGPGVYNAALAVLIVPGVTDPLPLQVWSRPKRVDENTQTPGQAYDVTEATVWTEFAVMRSRRS